MFLILLIFCKKSVMYLCVHKSAQIFLFQDVNDNPPVFSKERYTASIAESSKAGSSVLQVTATDGDRTKPNNEFLYRIDSGAGDKFRIDFKTGVIYIEVGAKLDRETKDSYTLNVSATDRGAVSMTGHCTVDITILDVNDEPPAFTQETFSASVNEESNQGKVVVNLDNIFFLLKKW